MMTQRLSSLLAGLLALGLFAASAAAQPADRPDTPDTATVLDPTAPDAVVAYGGPEPIVIETANGPVTFTIEVADTAESRTRGLMHRESMASDAGLLLDFIQPRVVSIWMENTLIPLDVIYIRPDGTIAKIVTGAVPGSRRQMWSDVPVRAVLELNSGRAEEVGIRPGDRVLHTAFGTAQIAGSSDEASTPQAEAGAEPDAGEDETAEPEGGQVQDEEPQEG